MWAVDERQLAWQQMKEATQHGAITVSSRASSPTWKLLEWQRGHGTARPHTGKHAHCKRGRRLGAFEQTHKPCSWNACAHTYTYIYRQSHHPFTYTNTVTGCGCKAQQDWNVTYCYCRHVATMEHHRQLARQCLHADLCRSLRTTGCCGDLLSSFNYLGIRSLVQQLLETPGELNIWSHGDRFVTEAEYRICNRAELNKYYVLFVTYMKSISK